MEKETQKEIWNSIAEKWEEYRKLSFEEVEEFLKGKKGDILDIGCGSGRNFRYIEGKIYACDFSEKMVEIAQKKLKEQKKEGEVVCAIADKLPYENDFFDHAIFVAALHCIDSKKARENAIKELYRVLKKEGGAIITVWSKNHKRIKKTQKEQYIPWTYEGKKHMRYYYIYDIDELIEILKKVGFKIISKKENENIIIEVMK